MVCNACQKISADHGGEAFEVRERRAGSVLSPAAMACTRKSSSRVRFRAKRTLEPTSPDDVVSYPAVLDLLYQVKDDGRQRLL